MTLFNQTEEIRSRSQIRDANNTRAFASFFTSKVKNIRQQILFTSHRITHNEPLTAPSNVQHYACLISALLTLTLRKKTARNQSSSTSDLTFCPPTSSNPCLT